MEIAANYEITRTADFIRSRGFTRVALQFPDELLKDSAAVVRALRQVLGRGFRLFVLADTVYGSCCVDEVGAAHVDAQCVVHFGHACMSLTSTLPAFFIFGKASIDVNACAESLHDFVSDTNKPILVLYGLEYAHALGNIKRRMTELFQLDRHTIYYAETTYPVIEPVRDYNLEEKQLLSHSSVQNDTEHFKASHNGMLPSSDRFTELGSSRKYSLGGLNWNIPVERKMEDHILIWIGSENSAFQNVVLTFNNCKIVRYDMQENFLVKDFSFQKRILMRRYYLVEKAKDANIVGVLVGTLGVAGYLRIVDEIKELIEHAGKKCYTLIMGRPTVAKLANFPECDIFVYVSCAQTALLDSKEFLAPLITPYEAALAFCSGRQWTGKYLVDFQHWRPSSMLDVVGNVEEARFSLIHGCYMEDNHIKDVKEETSSLALANMTEKALKVRNQCSDSVLFKGTATSAAEYLASRSYQGLSTDYNNPPPESYLIGRSGRAAAYDDEK